MRLCYTPNFTGWISDEVSTSRFVMLNIENNGPCTMRISSTAYIHNPGYSNLSGRMRLVDQQNNNLSYQNIKPGTSSWVIFRIEDCGAYYDSDTIVKFYFDYDTLSYSARTDAERFGMNKVTFSLLDD